jgi:hypothetical protein
MLISLPTPAWVVIDRSRLIPMPDSQAGPAVIPRRPCTPPQSRAGSPHSPRPPPVQRGLRRRRLRWILTSPLPAPWLGGAFCIFARRCAGRRGRAVGASGVNSEQVATGSRWAPRRIESTSRGCRAFHPRRFGTARMTRTGQPMGGRRGSDHHNVRHDCA